MTTTTERSLEAARRSREARLTLTLELTPELAIRLTNVAAHHQVPLPEYVHLLLEQAAAEEVPAASASRQIPTEEVMARGKEWYECHIRSQVNTPENKGKALVINVDTGEYEMDTTGMPAAQRLLAKQPDASLFWMRIGYRAYAKMGGAWRDVEE